MPTLEELKVKATELGITLEESATEVDIAAKIKEVEDEKNNKDPEYLKSEAKKAFKARDDAKEAKRIADAEIKKLKDQMGNTVKKDEYEDLKTQLNELREKEREREEAEDATKLEKASEVDKIKFAADKEEKKLRKEYEDKLNQKDKDFKKQVEEVTKLIEQNKGLRRKTLEGEIMIAAEKGNALNSRQIVRLLKEDFEWDDTYGKYVYYEKDIKGKVVDYHDVDTYVSDFLGKEENDNLVKSDINSNTFNSKRGTQQDIKPPMKDKDYKPTGKFNPADPVLIREARYEGMPVEKWIRIKEMRLKRLEQKK